MEVSITTLRFARDVKADPRITLLPEELKKLWIDRCSLIINADDLLQASIPQYGVEARVNNYTEGGKEKKRESMFPA